MKVLKIKKTPEPKSKFKEVIPMDDHHDDDDDKKEEKVDTSPKEEGDDSEEATDILKEAPAPPAPMPVLKEQPIVDANPAIL